jgi:SAM-dependent methyltransferase
MPSSKTLPAAQEYSNAAYWNDIHAAEAGKLTAVGYAALGEGFNKAAYKLRIRALERILRRNQACVTSTLEAAVGVGAYGPLWRRLEVRSWTGIDISPNAIKNVAGRYPDARFFVVDLSQPAFDYPEIGSSFDLVTAIDVLYHLVDDQSFVIALTNLAGCVRDGGHLVISDIFTDPECQTAPHVKRRPLSTYEAILVERGFQPIDREAVFAILADPLPGSKRLFAGRALFAVWQVLSKVISLTPRSVRNFVGGLLVTLLTPLDALLRRAGFARKLNLELAIFKRTFGPERV